MLEAAVRIMLLISEAGAAMSGGGQRPEEVDALWKAWEGCETMADAAAVLFASKSPIRTNLRKLQAWRPWVTQVNALLLDYKKAETKAELKKSRFPINSDELADMAREANVPITLVIGQAISDEPEAGDRRDHEDTGETPQIAKRSRSSHPDTSTPTSGSSSATASSVSAAMDTTGDGESAKRQTARRMHTAGRIFNAFGGMSTRVR